MRIYMFMNIIAEKDVISTNFGTFSIRYLGILFFSLTEKYYFCDK